MYIQLSHNKSLHSNYSIIMLQLRRQHNIIAALYTNLNTMSTNKHQFLKFFAADPQLPQNPGPLTHHLPPLTLLPSAQVQSLISKVRDSVAVISAVGCSPQFFTLTRRLLMLQQISHQQSPQHQPTHPINELLFYSKIEIGTTQPLEWIYTELRIKLPAAKPQFQSPIKLNSEQDIGGQNASIERITTANLLMSMVMIYEVTEQRHIGQLLKTLAAFHQKTTNLMHPIFPSFFLLHNAELLSREHLQQQLQQWSNKGLSFHLLQTPQSESLSWTDQHKLLSYSKLITGSLKPKLINRSTLTPSMLLKFLSIYLTENEEKEETVLTAWQKAQISEAEELAQCAQSQYLSKIQEITDGNNLLGVNFFRQIQAKVRSDVIRQVSDRAIKSGVGEQVIKTQRKLLECKEELESKNKWSILNWGRDFLKETYAVLDKKIGKDIKSLQVYRQEMQLFVEFFRKKSEQYLTLELALLFNDFALNKVFEATQHIHNTQMAQLQQQAKSLEGQISALNNQNKELRRKTNREESDLGRKHNQLRQKNLLFENRCELLERSSEALKEEISQTKDKYEDKLAKISERHFMELKQLREQCELLQDTQEDLHKQRTLLACELTKEKLLHEQTHAYYRQTIDNYKDKEEQFREEILQISMNSNRQLDLLKESSHRQNSHYHLSHQEMHAKVEQLETVIKEKDQLLLQANSEIQRTRISRTDKIDSFQNTIADLQLRNRLLEQKQTECDLMKNRVRKLEEELKRLAKEKDQQLQRCKEAEKQNLIAQQKCEYLEQSLTAERTKSKEATQSYQRLHTEKQTLQHKIHTQERKTLKDEWVQVEDTLQKEKLRTALQIIRELQGEYNRIKAESDNQKQPRRVNFPLH